MKLAFNQRIESQIIMTGIVLKYRQTIQVMILKWILTDVVHVHDYICMSFSPQWKGQVEGNFDWQLLQAGEGPGHSSADPGPGGRRHGGTACCVPRRHEGDVWNPTAVDRSEWFQGIQLLLSHLIQLDFADHMLMV